MPYLLIVIMVWGVWLLIPLATDGVAAVFNLLVVWFDCRRAKPAGEQERIKVSVVIPAYNEELDIDRCLLSLKAQTYPHSLMEIIVVDDGSSDGTVNQVMRHMSSQQLGFSALSFRVHAPRFGGTLNIIRRKRDGVNQHGKAAAVNAALAQISGDIIVAIDSDVVLAPRAIENAIRAFGQDLDMIAATGHLVIDPYLVVKTDRRGRPILNEYGMSQHKILNPSEELLTGCQFLEYLTTFHLGRRVESATNTMFTMSGACAVFRREVFDVAGHYRGRTVSEDADLTLAIHDIPGKRIGYLDDMEVHLAPVLSWSTLYSQRVRWQRGALEVVAVHDETTQARPNRKSLFWRLALPLRMQVDHTLAIPRLVWTFLIFLLPMFGYSWTVIRDAYLLMFAFYVGVNAARVLVAYAFSLPPEKVLTRRYLKYLFALPVYNMILYWTRMSAVLRTLTEDAAWTVENQFIDRVENGRVYRFSVRAFSLVIRTLF